MADEKTDRKRSLIGTKVQMWAGRQAGHSVLDPNQPMAGTILYVGDDGRATISMIDHGGNYSTLRSIRIEESNDSGKHGPDDSADVYATLPEDAPTTANTLSMASAPSPSPSPAPTPTPPPATGTLAEQSKPPAPGAAAQAPVSALNAGGTQSTAVGSQASPGGPTPAKG